MLSTIFLWTMIIGMILAVLGLIMFMTTESDDHDRKEQYLNGVISSTLAVFIASIGYGITHDYKEPEREYSNSNYELQVRVTEQNGVKDSTYIIIPRNKQNNE